MTTLPQPIEVEAQRIEHNPLDDIKVGDWYWVSDLSEEKSEPMLMCVSKVGSNCVHFVSAAAHGTHDIRIHFDEFESRCRFEPNWKEHWTTELQTIQRQMQEKTQELIRKGQKLNLLSSKGTEQSTGDHSFLPVKSTVDLVGYKKDLLTIQSSLPVISKEIDALAEDYAVVSKNMAFPDLVKLNEVRSALSIVEDRIFTIELYAGLQETIVQIADGAPASIDEKIAVRQQLLFMDEETLFDYEDGGMDFTSIEKFDAWVVRKENLSRILPDPKGIVAFRIRRSEKDYGTPSNLLSAWTHMMNNVENMQTYLLIRNGQKVYRIATALNFAPRLIPKLDEIGEDQFIESQSWRSKEKPKRITRDNVRYDDHVKIQIDLIKKYNRVVVLIQGLLDRSVVFHPHLPIKLMKNSDMREWVTLIRDEERGLPNNTVDWISYRDQHNRTLRPGKYVRIRFPQPYRNERTHTYENRYYDDEKKVERSRPHRGYFAKEIPSICHVESVKRDRSAVYISWPQEETGTPKKIWIPNPNRPGWGHYDCDYTTDRMFHEWVPMHFCFNLSDYTLGDYKMFLCDRTLNGKFLEWAPSLLTAEDWQRARLKDQRCKEKNEATID